MTAARNLQAHLPGLKVNQLRQKQDKDIRHVRISTLFSTIVLVGLFCAIEGAGVYLAVTGGPNDRFWFYGGIGLGTLGIFPVAGILKIFYSAHQRNKEYRIQFGQDLLDEISDSRILDELNKIETKSMEPG